MANLQFSQLPIMIGNDILDTASIVIPVQDGAVTKGITLKSLLQTVVAQNSELTAKCNALYSKLNQLAGEANKVIINQYYGGGTKIGDGAVSHAFVELYNPTNEEISLNGKSLHYFYTTSVTKLDLTGTIPAKTSFLIRCKHTNDGSLGLAPYLDLTAKEADQEWDIFVSNKCVAFALMGNTNEIVAGLDPTTLPDFIDLVGSTDDKGTAVPCYEGRPVPDQSKQKSVRRVLFSDTQDNRLDCEIVDYRIKENAIKAPKSVADGEWTI